MREFVIPLEEVGVYRGDTLGESIKNFADENTSISSFVCNNLAAQFKRAVKANTSASQSTEILL